MERGMLPISGGGPRLWLTRGRNAAIGFIRIRAWEGARVRASVALGGWTSSLGFIAALQRIAFI